MLHAIIQNKKVFFYQANLKLLFLFLIPISYLMQVFS